MANTNTDNKILFSELVKQECDPKPGLLQFFTSKPTNITNSENVEFDRVKSKRLTSKAMERYGKTQKNGTANFRNKILKTPIYKESRPYNIAEFRKRIAGEDIYTDSQVESIIMQKTAEDVAYLKNKVTRAEILQASYLFQTGTIPFKTQNLGDGNVEDVTFDAPAAHFADLTGGAGSEYWDNASADPIRDIETRVRLIKKNGCTKVKDIILGADAEREFLENSKIQAQLDNRRISRGEFMFQDRDMNGFSLLGFFSFAGDVIRLWSYEDYYLLPSDGTTTTDYIDPKKVVFIADGKYEIYYGGIDIIKDLSDPRVLPFLGTNAVRNIGDRIADSFYIDTLTDGDSSVEIRYQSAPLYTAKTPDTFGAMQVLA